MIKLLISSLVFITSIYSFSYTDIDGQNHNFSNFQGKRILIVNIATGSDKIGQLAELQQLQELYPDSLVVIGVPSNSFANEPRNNNEIKQFCQANYGVTFRLAAKGNVKNNNVLPLYQWLSHSTENGVMNSTVTGDFQKYLIDKTGQLIGVYRPEVSPLDTTITDAIAENW